MWRFENLDEAERTLGNNTKKIGYVKAYERIRAKDDERSEPIGRYDIPADVLAAAMQQAGPEGEDDGPDDVADDVGEDDDGPPSDPSKRLVYDMVEWLKSRAVQMMQGRGRGKFQVRGFTRAGKYVCSAVFIVINTDVVLPDGDGADDPQTQLDARPNVPPLEASQSAMSQAHADLAVAYSQALFSVFMPALQQIATMHMSMNGRLMAQNLRLDARCQQLVDTLTKHDLEVAAVEAGRSEEARSAQVRKEVASNALSELGSLGRAYVFARANIPVEYHSLMETLSSSPELAEAIKDPRVLAMLKKPENQASLVNILKAAAEQDAAGNPQEGDPATPPPAT